MLSTELRAEIESRPVELLHEIVDSNVGTREILDFLNDVLYSGEVGERFIVASGGSNHHKKIGGLLKHSLEVAYLSLFACDMYELNGVNPINRELLLCNALLHDIGKINQPDSSSLIGHEVESMHVLYPFLDRSKLSFTFKEQFAHCILTHMSNVRDEGTKAIRMLESFIVHSMDGISAYSDVYVTKVTIATPKGIEVSTNFKRMLTTAVDK